MDEIVWIGDEEEIAKHLDRGYCSLKEWRDYWFYKRCNAFIELDAIGKRQAALTSFVNRCTKRIEDDCPHFGARTT